MKPKFRYTTDGQLIPILRPFEQEQVRRLVSSLVATPKHIAFVALQEYQSQEGMK